MSIQQNLSNEWNEQLEKSILTKYKIVMGIDAIIAFRSMLETGMNTFEDLKEQLYFVRCFMIYRFSSDCVDEILNEPETYWDSSIYDFCYCIIFHRENFYKINKTIYYIDW